MFSRTVSALLLLLLFSACANTNKPQSAVSQSPIVRQLIIGKSYTGNVDPADSSCVGFGCRGAAEFSFSKEPGGLSVGIRFNVDARIQPGSILPPFGAVNQGTHQLTISESGEVMFPNNLSGMYHLWADGKGGLEGYLLNSAKILRFTVDTRVSE